MEEHTSTRSLCETSQAVFFERRIVRIKEACAQRLVGPFVLFKPGVGLRERERKNWSSGCYWLQLFSGLLLFLILIWMEPRALLALFDLRSGAQRQYLWNREFKKYRSKCLLKRKSSSLTEGAQLRRGCGVVWPRGHSAALCG